MANIKNSANVSAANLISIQV